MSVATARVHVNRYSSLLNKIFGFYNSSLDGAEWQGSCGFGHGGQANRDEGTTT
jgi:hypothetical protein